MKSGLILIVDDEPRYLRLLQYNLETSGYRVVAAATGEEAVQVAAGRNPNLILLDLRLPELDGYEVCRRLREFSSVPIIMVTALGEEVDKIRGLRLGADDYITKPFSAAELLARVEAVLRRYQLPTDAQVMPRLVTGELMIDFAQRRAFLGGQEVMLSATEYRLLHCLATRAGKVMTPEEIQEKVWGAEYREYYEGLRTHIHRLRQKIEQDPNHPKYILTRHGMGYLLALTDSTGEEE